MGGTQPCPAGQPDSQPASSHSHTRQSKPLATSPPPFPHPSSGSTRMQDAHNLLRPESIESFYLLWKVTGDPQYQQWAWQVHGACGRSAGCLALQAHSLLHVSAAHACSSRAGRAVVAAWRHKSEPRTPLALANGALPPSAGVPGPAKVGQGAARGPRAAVRHLQGGGRP